jgi:epoxide hydrolase-like predicted phosphatase
MTKRMDEFQLTREQFMPIVLGPLREDGDHPWHRAERGELDLAGFDVAAEPLWRAAGLTGAFPSPPSAAELIAAIGPATEMVEVARDARAAGYQTAIVSNMVSDWSVWRTVVDADSLVDVVIDSSEVGLRKPDEAIFRLALERLGVSAERSIFLDDFEWNLSGAVALGMHTMHVTDTEVAAAELRDRLGLPVGSDGTG